MKIRSSVQREGKQIWLLWRNAEVGSARGWFLLGALWALNWVLRSHSRPAKFAEREWECDQKRYSPPWSWNNKP